MSDEETSVSVDKMSSPSDTKSRSTVGLERTVVVDMTMVPNMHNDEVKQILVLIK